MRELKNVIRRGRTAGLTPAHYAISDVPAGIFDADVFAHFPLSFSVSLSLSIRWVGECVVVVVVVVVVVAQRGRVDRGWEDSKKSNKKNP